MKNIQVIAIALGLSLVSLTGCTAVSLVDAAASTAIGVGKVAVKSTTAVVGAVIPDGDDKKK